MASLDPPTRVPEHAASIRTPSRGADSRMSVLTTPSSQIHNLIGHNPSTSARRWHHDRSDGCTLFGAAILLTLRGSLSGFQGENRTATVTVEFQRSTLQVLLANPLINGRALARASCALTTTYPARYQGTIATPANSAPTANGTFSAPYRPLASGKPPGRPGVSWELTTAVPPSSCIGPGDLFLYRAFVAYFDRNGLPVWTFRTGVRLRYPTRPACRQRDKPSP